MAPPPTPSTTIAALAAARMAAPRQGVTLRLMLQVYTPKGYRTLPGGTWTGRWTTADGQPTAGKLWAQVSRVWWRWFPPPMWSAAAQHLVLSTHDPATDTAVRGRRLAAADELETLVGGHTGPNAGVLRRAIAVLREA